MLNTAAWQGGPRPPSNPLPVAPLLEQRTRGVAARVTPSERAAWRAKAAAAGVSPSALLREAMARTRTWTASARAAERERTRQIARVGNNLNQLARWANTHKTAAVADSLEFERKYTSVVIAWAPEDRPTGEQIEAVLDEFERTAWAGLEPDRYAWTAVLHRERGGGVHAHILAAQCDLQTGRSLNSKCCLRRMLL